MARRLTFFLVVLAALAGCVRVKGLPLRPSRPHPDPARARTAACERTRAIEADRAAWEAVHPALVGKIALASSRAAPVSPPGGRVHIVGAVESNVAEAPDGGAPLGELIFGVGRPTWDADLTRIAVVESGRAWLIDWWNLGEGGLRSCPFRVGGGSLVVVFPSRGHEAELRYRFWDTMARAMEGRADGPTRARAAAASLCKPIE